MKLFTIGYEKRDIDDFINVLRENEIGILVDIRAIPHSRNKDYSKRNLERHLFDKGIAYLLIKELGSPGELREKVRSGGDYGDFFIEYGKFLGNKGGYLSELLKITKNERACLFCYEADVNRCHRSSVASKLKSLEPDLEIVDL